MRFRAIFLSPLVVIATACGPVDRTPKSHRADGIQFDYPGNWRITKDDANDGSRVLIVEGPHSSIVVLTIVGRDWALTLDVYAATYAEAMRAEVPLNLVKRVDSQRLNGAIELKLDMKVLGIAVPHTANITEHAVGEAKVICVTQVSDEDRPRVAEGFQLVRRSLAPAPKEADAAGSPPR